MTFAGQPLLGTMSADLPCPVVGDPSLGLYSALGSRRGSWWRILSPRVWLHGIRLAARGHRPRGPQGQDVRQLGGVAIVDRDCRLRWLRVQRDPADYPSIGEIAAAAHAVRSA